MGQLTEAPVPGTTVGIVRVEGVLSGQAKLFDTPGILHPYQITTRLTREEQKLVHVGKELSPRSYRIKVCSDSIALLEFKIHAAQNMHNMNSHKDQIARASAFVLYTLLLHNGLHQG